MKREYRKKYWGWFFLIILVLFSMHKTIMQTYFILDYKPQILAYSKNNNLNPALVSAIVFVESHFDAAAESHKGAMGLMQIMPTTGRWVAEQLKWEQFSYRDLLDPRKNLEVGVWYLAYLKHYFNENESLALASYNAGHRNVSKWVEDQVWDGDMVKLEKIPFPETKNYVFRINFLKKVYEYLYPDLCEPKLIARKFRPLLCLTPKSMKKYHSRHDTMTPNSVVKI